MTRAILLSLDAWENISTLTPAVAIAPNVRAAMPGTPGMPSPSTVISARSRMTVTALTAPAPGALAAVMSVPGCSGLKVFLMRIGTPAATAGTIVRGWMTLEPK